MHAPCEDEAIRVENLVRVVQLMTGIQIEKRLVPTGGTIIRGLTERYADRARILIRKEQPIEWQKYATIKELCHIVYDEVGDFEPKPINTLEQLVLRRGLDLDEEASPAMISERLAEIMALELAYPFEFRRKDRDALAAGGVVDAIVAKRCVPAVHIEGALSEGYIDACEGIWNILPESNPPPLTWED
jgi:hypothetical protein